MASALKPSALKRTPLATKRIGSIDSGGMIHTGYEHEQPDTQVEGNKFPVCQPHCPKVFLGDSSADGNRCSRTLGHVPRAIPFKPLLDRSQWIIGAACIASDGYAVCVPALGTGLGRLPDTLESLESQIEEHCSHCLCILDLATFEKLFELLDGHGYIAD